MKTIDVFNVFRILRPQHWIKNIFIFLPMFFSKQLFDVSVLLSCIVAFIAFSFAASSIYCFNDICDIEKDKLHPEKCKRPIASGVISTKTAYAIMIICFLLAMSVLLFFGGNAKYMLIALILSYYVMNFVYCAKLKRYAIIDVVIISIGFVLRVLVGGTVSGVQPSEWIILITFFLALFLAFAKRRDDVVLHKNTGICHRENTNLYNLEFMNHTISIIAAIILFVYIMYVFSPDVVERFNGKTVYFTVIFVFMGIIRYLQITIIDLKSGSPEKILLRDRFIQYCIVGWVISFCGIIYL